MAISKVRNLIQAAISLEDDSAAPAVEINVNVSKDAAAADKAAADAEDAQSDLDDEADDIDDQQEASDQVEESAANLESIAMGLEAALKEGGLGTQALTFANMAINNELRRLGLEEHKVSLEAMGTGSGRIAQTKIALEETQNIISKTAHAIAEFFKKIYEKIVAFFEGIFGKAARLERYANSLKTVAESQEKEGLKAEGKTMELKDVRFIQKGVGENKAVVKPDALPGDVKHIFANVREFNNLFTKELQAIASSATVGTDSREQAADLSTKMISSMAEKHASSSIGGNILAKNISTVLSRWRDRREDYEGEMVNIPPAKKETVDVVSPAAQKAIIEATISDLRLFKEIGNSVKTVVSGAKEHLLKKTEGFGERWDLRITMNLVQHSSSLVVSYSHYAFYECMAILGYVHKSQKELAKTAKAA